MHNEYDSDVEKAIVHAFGSDNFRASVYTSLFKWAVDRGYTNRVDFNSALSNREEAALISQFPDGTDNNNISIYHNSNGKRQGKVKTSMLPTTYITAKATIGRALEIGNGLEGLDDSISQAKLAEKNAIMSPKRKRANKDMKVVKAFAQIIVDINTGPIEDADAVKSLILSQLEKLWTNSVHPDIIASW